MSLKIELAEVMNKDGFMYDVAEKVNYGQQLTSEEKDAFEISDAWCREIGRTGNDKNNEIAAFVCKLVNNEIYNAPDELLDTILERGSVGEFDEVEHTGTPKNTLVAHLAAKGGTVDRSFIDYSAVKPITRNRQVETEIGYAELRKNGFKSVATLTTYAKEALQNMLFYDVFSIIDEALISGDNVTAVTGKLPTQTAVDAFNLYLLDRSPDAVAVCLSKYAQALGRMQGRADYMSSDMKDEFNRYGLTRFVDGVRVASVSGAAKNGNGNIILPDKRIFGVAGKIGALDMKGELHVYEDMDNANDKVIIRVKDFTYSVSITNIENCNKMTFTE